MLDKNPCTPKFLNKEESCFRDIRGTCDSVYRGLRSKGIGAEISHTPLISDEEETQLWKSEVLCTSTPKGLQRAVFYYVGKCFCIRGGQEQRSLGPSNFKFSAKPNDDPYLVTYIEHGSKNRSGGVNQLRLENKEVPFYAIVENVPACVVFLLDMYLKMLPKFAFENDILYLRPKSSAPSNPDVPWYEEAPVGKNTLSTMVKDMCVEAGISKKTNHSLRATGASTMFQANVPEKLIQKTTGHKSLEALRSYERVSVDQQKALSRVIVTNSDFQSNVNHTNAQNVMQKSGPSSNLTGRLFGDLTNCSIGSITINVNPVINMKSKLEEEADKDFDELVKDMIF